MRSKNESANFQSESERPMNFESHPSSYDCLVIGGGPAGTTAATVLAKYGRKVLILEKEHFPRYHVGESLIPFCYQPLERIGMIEKLQRSGFVKKYSVQFASQDGRISTPFYFSQHTDQPWAQTWQVTRSEFDQMMLDHAREHGVEVREGVTVTDHLRDGSQIVGVKATDEQGQELEFRAPLTIDATGRDALSCRKLGWRNRDPKLNKVAIWTYYQGAKRDAGIDEGATTVAFLPDKGWFWYIPLAHDRVSVGVVAERDYLFDESSRDRGDIFEREITKNEWIRDHLSTGKCEGEYWVTGEYSYRSRHCADDGLVLAGDAFAFLDPVFSSGVMLAVSSGEMAADAVEAALRSGDYSGAAFTEYGDKLCRGIENMRRLVYAFYNPDFTFGQVLKAYPHLQELMTDCLIGDVFSKDYSPLFAAVSEFADLPEDLPYGRSPAAIASQP